MDFGHGISGGHLDETGWSFGGNVPEHIVEEGRRNLKRERDEDEGSEKKFKLDQKFKLDFIAIKPFWTKINTMDFIKDLKIREPSFNWKYGMDCTFPVMLPRHGMDLASKYWKDRMVDLVKNPSIRPASVSVEIQ